MSKPVEYKALFLGAGPQMQCGVGQFTHLLREAVEQLDRTSCTVLTLTRSAGSLGEIWRAIGSAQTVVCNFPIVAWKRVILRPLLALAFARLRGRRVVLIQHEWASLHWLRRLTYLPALLLANTIVMFSPQVRRELASDPIIGRTAAKCVLAPLPPNIEAPSQTTDTPLRRRLKAARQDGRMVIGHFGSIYPGKQPNTLLNVSAILRDRGHRPLTVYIGSFIKALDNVEAGFHSRVSELGLSDDVIVSGYVDSSAEVFGLFGEVDAFCYPLEEGLTARRASILTAVQAGRPVIVTGPSHADEFDHHLRFKSLIEHGAIVLVPRGSSGDVYADAILNSLERPAAYPPLDFPRWWHDAASAIKAQL